MSVSNNDNADELVFNAAYLSRTADSDTVAVVGLKNPSSGGDVNNAQQAINDNTTNIATNTSDIATNTSDIGTNTTNIATNTADIATNTAAIAAISVPADTDGLPEGATNLYYTEARVNANASVVANTAKVSADGSIDTHSDVDTSTVAPTDGQVMTWVNANGKWEPKAAPGAGVVTLITASSSIKTPAGNNQFHQHTGNSLALLAGKKYRIFGVAAFGSSGGSAGYTTCVNYWKAANGADSGVNPADLSTATGLTILTPTEINNQIFVSGAAVSDRIFSAQSLIVQTTVAVTIYLDTYATLTTPANGRVQVFTAAEEL